jgi:hypothetical protein
VDQDYGGAEALSFKTSGGAGIGDAKILAYLKSEYDVGTYTVRAQTVTDDNGAWESPMYLDSGLVYTLVYKHPGYALVTEEVTIA